MTNKNQLSRWVGLLSIGLLACVTDRSAIVPRGIPSPLARWGHRVRVLPFDGEGDTGFSASIATALARGGAFEPASDGADITVSGAVLEGTLSAEHTSSTSSTCHRRVPETRTRQARGPGSGGAGGMGGGGGGTPGGGGSETYTVMVDQPFPCTRLARWVDGRFRVHIEATSSATPPRPPLARDIDLHDELRTTGTSGSGDQDNPPAAVDGAQLLRTLRERAVARFARSVMPRSDSVAVGFADCHEDDCDAAVELVRRGDTSGAVRLFSAVVDRYASATSSSGRERLAAALFDRGVLVGYGGLLAEGIADLTRAVALQPDEALWGRHLAAIRQMQADEAEPTPVAHE